MVALERTWHPEHLCCTLCGVGFNAAAAAGAPEKAAARLLVHEGEPVCVRCFVERLAPRCAAPDCGHPLLGEHVAAGALRFHTDCFKCRVCTEQIVLYTQTLFNYRFFGSMYPSPASSPATRFLYVL